MKPILKAIIPGLILLVYGCKHHPDYNGTPIVDTNCDANTVYFQNTILPLLNAHCGMAGCHNSISNAEGINLTSYSSIMNSSSEGALVIPNDANGSKLVEVISNGEMPPYPGTPLSNTELQLIMTWINQGALNNYCADCDTTKFKFNADILPIITTKCSGCHGAVNPSGMTTILNYANVKTLADNGKLAGVITGVGYSLMPSGVGLPDCERTKILKWINNGAQND